MKRRARKLHEFVAHSRSISTARLGQLSSKFVVSGGDDSLVNIFRIDQSAPLLTLAGHTQRVTCAVFDPREEVVAAGSEGGALKLWNLSRSSTSSSSSSSSSSQASASGSSRRLKPSRSFTGHRAAIAALDFHPYGVCLASGGVDTNLKMWDLKRVGSGCFCTFKEHRAPVGCVRHSPDGKWLVSGDDDGCVHVWDLTAAKSIGTLQMPSGGAVTCFDFHPAEYYLACGGSSNVAVFDLESFSLVCETSHEAKPVTRVAFSAAGDALITASGDAIKTWKWQPSAVCIDVEHMGWRTPADFSVTADHELVAIATEATVLSVFHVDLNTMAPLNGRDEPYAAQDAPADGGAPNAGGDGESARPRDAQHFVPRRRVSKFRSSGSSGGGGRRRGHVRGRSSGASASASSPTSGIVKGKSGGKRSSGGKKASNGNMMDDDELAAVVGRTWGEPPVIREGEVGHNPLESFVPPPSRFPAPARDDADIDVAVAVKQTSQASLQRARRAREEAPAAVDPRESTLIAVGNEPAGLRVSQFLPPVEEQEALHAAALEGAESHEQVDPEQVLADLLANHDQMLRALSKRKPNLQLLQMYWRQGDVKGALVELAHMHDAQCAVDFLNAAQVQLRRCLTLDLCVDLLPVLNELLKSKYERYVVTALHYVTMLAETFGQLIADTRDAATAAHNRGAGLDPNLEERLERCNACVDLLRGSRTELERLARRHGEIGVLASTAVSHVGAFL